MVRGQDVVIWNENGTYAADVTSDDRLKVDAEFDDDVSLAEWRGKLIVRHLTLNGAEPYSLSNGDMTIDGSVTPQPFYRIPPSGKKWFVAEMRITIQGASINHTKFGGISALTNGIDFKVTENGAERDLYEHNIKTNGSFRHISSKVDIDSSTTDILSVTLDFRGMGSTLRLLNSTSDNLKVTVNDNLTTVSFMEVTIFGYEVDE